MNTQKTSHNLIRKSTTGALIAAALNLLVYLIAQGAGVNLQVAAPNSTEPMPLSWIPVVMASIVPAFAAAGVLALFARFVPRGPALFQTVGWLLVVLSLFSPFGLPVGLANKLVLVVMHLVAGSSILLSLGSTVQTRRVMA